MAEDNEKKEGEVGDLDKELLDEALREFDAAGGFTGRPKGVKTPPVNKVAESQSKPDKQKEETKTDKANLKKNIIDEEFPHFDDEDPLPQPSKEEASSNNDSKSKKIKDNLPQNIAKEDDFEDFESEEFDDEDDFEGDDIDLEIDNNVKGGNNGNGGGKDGDGGRKDMIIKKLKEPKNIIIMVIAFLFLLFVIFSGGKKKQKPIISKEESAEINNTIEADINNAKKEEKLEQVPENAIASQIPNISLADIQLPNLDIKVPEIKAPEVDLIPKIPEPKIQELPPKDEKKPEEKKQDIVNINNINNEIETQVPEAIKPEDDFEDIDIKVSPNKRREVPKNKEELKPIVTDFTGGTKITKKKSKNNAKDFIFIDSDIEAEAEENVINATRIQDPENVVAQGRIIDAVLETAINSTIGGQIRAIVVRDVYAETGRNILIPKGTRLYGEYGGASGKQSVDRIVITWTRIMRPDNISANINSFAADQFGRSGIQGHSDNKYFSNIATSILLSTIPLVTTIVTNAITNSRQNTVTTNGVGGATVVQDPINIATQSFAQQVSNTTSEIIKNTQDLQPTITLEQGTRVKVLVNQDIKLPAYKSITKVSSGITS